MTQVDHATSSALELPVVLRLLSQLTVTDLGNRRALESGPYGAGELLLIHARHRELEQLLDQIGSLVPALAESTLPALERLERQVSGSALDLVRLGSLLQIATASLERISSESELTVELTRWCAELMGVAVESLAEAAGSDQVATLGEKLAKTLDERGEVREDATPELRSIRGRVRRHRQSVYSAIQAWVRQHGDQLADEAAMWVEGRVAVLLPAGHRGRLQGIVAGRSSSGRSYYFEPLELIEPNNGLQGAIADLEAEKARLVAELYDEVRYCWPAIERRVGLVGELDLLQARARFGRRCGGVLPELVEESTLTLVGARHPLLDPQLAELRDQALDRRGSDEPVVPLDLDLSEDRLLVITGPNAGGKTVALKTAGLLTLMACCGLPLPTASGTRIGQFDRVVAVIGDEQDLLEHQSTFSSRLKGLGEVFSAARGTALLLVDELGSGTAPDEGSALGIALVEELLEGASITIITTHLTEIAMAALEHANASCAAMSFDRDSGRPTYRFHLGPPGGSQAIGLARRLGLPSRWVDRAETLLGEERRQLRNLLVEVEQLRGRLEQREAELEGRLADQVELESRLVEARQRIERDARAERSRLRQKIETHQLELRRELKNELAKLARRFELERRHAGKLEARLGAELARGASATVSDLAQESELPSKEQAVLELGGQVRHRLLGWQGTLESLDGERATVVVLGKRVRVRSDELAVSAPVSRRNSSRVSLPAVPEVPIEVNLVGQRVAPALDQLDNYLDRALLANLDRVRVIHGHGSGRLRRAVREHLSSHPAVARQRVGATHEGGDGATVVELRSTTG